MNTGTHIRRGLRGREPVSPKILARKVTAAQRHRQREAVTEGFKASQRKGVGRNGPEA